MINENYPLQDLAIGMFDSGLGGLTVMKEIIRLLPHEEICYFGDTARVPYGEKSADTIVKYSIENAIFLMEQNIKLLVISCNTSSAYSSHRLQKLLNVPVVDVIEPGADKVLQTSKNGRIAVLGTKGTINSGVYQREILKRRPDAKIFPLACPLFVPLIEENFIEHSSVHLIVQEYLKPIRGMDIDTVLLGCTHYPLLKSIIQNELGGEVAIVDSASACAEKVVHMLEYKKLVNSNSKSIDHRFFVSDDPEKFRLHGSNFLGKTIPSVHLVKT